MKKTRTNIGGWMGYATILVAAVLALGVQQMMAFETAGNGPAAGSSAALVAFAAAPQQQEAASEQAAAEHGEGEAEEHSLMEEFFHWFNFLLILAGTGYLVKKYLVPFLEERGKLIREDMDRSAKALADADQRLAAVEDRLKNMSEEMASLRQAAFHESAAERERVEKAAAADADKILATAEQEIEAAVKAARQELKVFTSGLALQLAEKNIRDSITPSSEQRILRNFVEDLSAAGTTGNGQKNADPPERKQE